MSVMSQRNKKKLAKKIAKNPCSHCKHSLLCLSGLLDVHYHDMYACLHCRSAMVKIENTYMAVPAACKLLNGFEIIRNDGSHSTLFDKRWERAWNRCVIPHSLRYTPGSHCMTIDDALKIASQYFCSDCVVAMADKLMCAANNREKKGARRRVSKEVREARRCASRHH